ncbi:unnamed protein product [Caenorhabditis nigoni]
MFYSILLLALLLGSAEMCGNLVQSNAPSKQSDIGSGEETVTITFLDATTNKMSCTDFENEVTDGTEKGKVTAGHCKPDATGQALTLTYTSCADVSMIANLPNKYTAIKSKFKKATFTCNGATMNVEKMTPI